MKAKYPLLAAILVTAASCNDKLDVQTTKHGETVTIKAVQADDAALRTALVDGGSVWWNPGDDLSLFYGSGADGGSRFTADITEPAPIANFTGIIDVVTGGGEMSMEATWFWATYPYNANASCDGSSIVTELPCSQVGKAGTFSDKTFITVAKSQGLLMSFYNVCSGLKFSVTNPEVEQVRIKSNGGEPIAGKARISFDGSGVPYISEVLEGTDEITISAPDGGCFEAGQNYYITMLPQTLESGFTVTFETWYEQGTREIAKKATFKRAVFNTMASADKDVTYTVKPYAEFEDPDFEAYCISKFDTDGDGRISRAEALAVTSIDVSSQIQDGTITSLNGIGVFVNLKSLYCSGNYDKIGELKSLDVSRNTALEGLYCSYNQLTSLDVSNNTALRVLDCRGNQLPSLNVSKNAALTYLDCGSNQLPSLDVSNNTALTDLSCYVNQLTSLDVSNNTALKSLNCGGNQLPSLDVSKNTALTDLSCYSNQLTSLDVSNNTALRVLDCRGNQLPSLDVSKNTALTRLICYDNQLTSLDVSKNNNLKSLSCWSNQLSGLDVSKNAALTYLDCSNNPLSYLYISQGQSIPNVTVNRSTSYIPSQTTILVGSSAGGNEGTGEGTNY